MSEFDNDFYGESSVMMVRLFVENDGDEDVISYDCVSHSHPSEEGAKNYTGNRCDLCWLDDNISMDGAEDTLLRKDDPRPTSKQDVIVTGKLWWQKYVGMDGADYDGGWKTIGAQVVPAKASAK